MALQLFIIPFSQDPPTPERIREKVSAITGLEITMLMETEASGQLSSPEFKRPCVFAITSNTVELEIARWSYFQWAVVAALIDLGGTIDGRVPWFVSIKWHERKWWHFLPQ